LKIEVWFLLRSRQAKQKKVNENVSMVDMHRGIYLMNRNAINFYSKGDKPKGVETFFFEGNPAPIQIDEQGKDTSINFLNQFIYENAIEYTGALPKERMRNAFGWAQNNITIGAIVKWGFVLLIIGSLIGAQLGFV